MGEVPLHASMISRPFIISATVVLLILGAVGGVYAYDRSGRDRIPKGVTIAGVDVGGLTKADAKLRLEREYVTRLEAPVKVYHGQDTFVLTAAQSQVRANVDQMVDDALAQWGNGNMFTRTLRRITGGKLDKDLEPEATFNKGNVVRFLDSIRSAVDRDPIEAKVAFVDGTMKVQDSRDGLKVRAHELHAQIRAAVTNPNADHTLVARTDHTPPKTTTKDLDKQYRTALVVNRSKFRLTLYKDFRVVRTYPIGIGMQGLETPAGLYHIQNKAVNPAWTMPNSSWVAPADRGKVVPGGIAANPLKARWLGIYDGAGIHGVDPSEYSSIGRAESHGCVRMKIPDVIDLYDRVPVGAPIYIS